MSMVRLFYAADIHGSETCFRKFIVSWKYYGADVLILGGDLTGKAIIPIEKKSDSTYKAIWVTGRELTIKTPEELKSLENRIKGSGYYIYYTDSLEDLTKEKIDDLFLELMNETYHKWVHLAEERLKNTKIKLFICPGNDDHLDLDIAFEKSDVVINAEGKVVRINDEYEMISTGYTNITPWHCYRDIPEEQLEARIESMAKQVENMQNCIFNFHCPPHNTDIDLAPQLDEELRPVLGSGGGPKMIPVGCTSVRALIQKYQPLLGLHGHIHESKGIFRLGRTTCVNPGSEYSEGILRGALVTLKDGKMKSIQLTEG